MIKHTNHQIKPGLRTGSVLMFDAGATGNPNLDFLVSDRMKYLSRMKLNTNGVNHHLNTFSKHKLTRVIRGKQKRRGLWEETGVSP